MLSFVALFFAVAFAAPLIQERGTLKHTRRCSEFFLTNGRSWGGFAQQVQADGAVCVGGLLFKQLRLSW